jgi:hypothetical protein
VEARGAVQSAGVVSVPDAAGTTVAVPPRV